MWNKLIIILLCLTCWLICLPAEAQINGSTIRVEGENIVIRIDKKSKDYAVVMAYFGLQEDSLFNHGSIGKLSGEGWFLMDLKRRSAKIARPITAADSDIYWGNQAILFDMRDGADITPGYPGNVAYGVNSFAGAPTVFENAEGHTVFYLPRNTTAHTVFLSGNFNDWSTGSTAMQRTDSGWIYTLHLTPGKYYYKFIVDGNWLHDMNNLLKEPDGHHGYNSAYYRTNHTVQLKGYTGHNSMILAGSFNNWNERELSMQRTPEGWMLRMYLREGTYTYKFIADGQWMLDPYNPVARPDGEGNVNSVMALGDTTFFMLEGYTEAKVVILSGNFNNWNTGELIMERTPTGWQIPYVLPAGTYEYKFIVDGTWIIDPANPITAGWGQELNSVRSVKPNHIFKLEGYPEAKEVYVTGSAIGWQEPGYKLTNVQGVWKVPVYLAPGKYTYKFIVDGNWILDPANPQTEQNRFNTGNSVLWITGDHVFRVD